MEMLQTFMGMFGFGDLGMGSVLMIFVGACLGWCVPQPAFAKPIVDLVCEKLGLSKFHEEGHVDEEAKEEVKTDDIPK